MRVYFVRHGESELNKTTRHQSPDEKLSPLGLKQAKMVAKRFGSLKVDVILSSHYDRAQATAEEIAKITKSKIVTNDKLFERLQPSIFWGKEYDDPRLVDAKKSILENMNDADWHHSDEENFHDFKQRAKDIITELEGRSEEHIVVVTHGIFLMVIFGYLMFGDELTPGLFNRVYGFTWTHNTGISVVDYRYPKLGPHEMTGHKRWRLMTWNDHSHLGEIEE